MCYDIAGIPFSWWIDYALLYLCVMLQCLLTSPKNYPTSSTPTQY
uniref:Uncharacterized protein n=1 Tax=Anguilla anguilla TaxID=7936 RepID=A0A0E9VNR7_ANGAN